MRILRIIASMNPRVGGPAAGLRAITPMLRELGHETEFATTEAPQGRAPILDGCPIHRLGPTLLGYQYTPRLYRWIRDNHKRFDVIVVHGLWQYHGSAAYAALKGTDTPYFVFPHGMLDPWFKRAYPLKHLKKWSYWQLGERFLLKKAAAVLFTCEQERRLARQSFAPYSCTERVVLYGAERPQTNLPEASQAFRNSLPALGAAPYLLFLSRIHPKKGLDLLIEAYTRVAEQRGTGMPHLVIAGPTENNGYLESLQKKAASGSRAGTIHWPGMLLHAEKWGAFAGAEAFVLPSHQENFGIAVAEALAVGRPVIISDQVNTWREIADSKAGIINPDTLEGTITSLNRWLDMPEQSRVSMSAAATACFDGHFDMKVVAESLVSTLTPFLKKTPASPKARGNLRSSEPQPLRPLRLLQVTTSMDAHIGGPPAVLRAITPVLTSMGYTTEFATCEAPLGPRPETLMGCPIHRLGPPRLGYQYSALLSAWIRNNSHRFDAVFVHGLWQHHGLSTRKALIDSGVPYFVYPHGMLDPWFKHTYPLKHLKKWFYWNFVEKHLLRDAAAVLFTCEEERRLAPLSFSNYRCNELVLEFGTARPTAEEQPSCQAFRQAFPHLGDRPFLLFMSRVHPKKGVDLLLKAYGQMLKKNPRALPELVIAGPCADEHYLASLKKLALCSCPPDKVHWIGMIENEVKWGALFRCEAFILPSHQENFGIAVAEAMAVARPVLISDKVNIWREIIMDGGGIAGLDTLEGTLQTLRQWEAMSPIKRIAMGEAARRCFEKRFEINSVARSLISAVAPFVKKVATMEKA